MKIENIEQRIEKSKEKVKKCEASIERNMKQLDKLHKENGSPYRIKFKQDDIISATKKLEDAKRILKNWENKLKIELKKEEKINSEVPEVIKVFLENWKKDALEWHLKRYDGMMELKKSINEQVAQATEEYQKNESTVLGHKYRKYMAEMNLDDATNRKRISEYAGDTVLIMGRMRDKEEREQWIEDLLEENKKQKMIDLITRIKDKAGEIEDASKLEISPKGNLDGVIKGSIATVKIETIGAGGLYVQCFHYRTLIKPQK